MPIGFRAFLDIERPDPALIEAYREIPSSNIGDCVKRMNCMFGGIRAYNKLRVLGPAFTVKVPAGDNLVAQMALDYAMPGDVIVIDGAGYTDRALVGGMMLAYAEERKLGGFVVNGAVRDLDDIQASPLPVYALAATPLGPYREGPGEVNVPVVCGGQVVMPGDLLVGDSDGLVVIPRRDAPALLDAVHRNLSMEQNEMRRMKDGSYTEAEHREIFTSAFLKRGGSFV
ncbi:MAG: RraA family protein [Eubacteriales bacterium]|nr:RraA family protein [Eubacteriales bacterium]